MARKPEHESFVLMLLAHIAKVVSFASAVGSSGASLADVANARRDAILKNRKAKKEAREAWNALMQAFWAVCEESESFAFFAQDWAKEFAKSVKDYADFLADDFARANRPPVPKSVASATEEGKKERAAAAFLVSYLEGSGWTEKDFADAKIPVVKRKGGFALDDKKVPVIGRGNKGSSAGRPPAMSRTMRYMVNGTSLPVGITVRKAAAMYVSEGSDRVTTTEFTEWLRKVQPKGTEEFDATFTTRGGRKVKVRAWNPPKEEDAPEVDAPEVDDDDQDEEEEQSE